MTCERSCAPCLLPAACCQLVLLACPALAQVGGMLFAGWRPGGKGVKRDGRKAFGRAGDSAGVRRIGSELGKQRAFTRGRVSGTALQIVTLLDCARPAVPVGYRVRPRPRRASGRRKVEQGNGLEVSPIALLSVCVEENLNGASWNSRNVCV